MKKFFFILTAIALMTWGNPAWGQSTNYGTQCQFYNIEKTVKAKLYEGEDTALQRNYLKILWPVMLNDKDCPKLQEALCLMMTGRDDIKQLDKAIEYTLYTDNESVPFKDKASYELLDEFGEEEFHISCSSSTIDLKSLGNRFALYHQLYDIYFAGAAHGIFGHNYVTYDTKLDKVVTLEDVLIDPEMIREYILPSLEIHYGYTEEDLFLPESQMPEIPNEFYFEDGTFHLVYQVYQIAGFANGPIDVPLYYPSTERIPDYLTPYGKEVMEESYEQELY
ncbi:MAG: hypothetical protein IKX18_01960 [Muribaculaceae bacterium]|nr:hypothetical protein [Muribaculaceae bacterium]